MRRMTTIPRKMPQIGSWSMFSTKSSFAILRWRCLLLTHEREDENEAYHETIAPAITSVVCEMRRYRGLCAGRALQ